MGFLLLCEVMSYSRFMLTVFFVFFIRGRVSVGTCFGSFRARLGLSAFVFFVRIFWFVVARNFVWSVNILVSLC